jgi:toxin ParE1/3/4
MTRLRFAPQAAADLEDIGAHIASAAGTERALLVLDRLELACRRLARRPALGRSRDDLARGLRSFPVWPYVVIYRGRGAGIEVVRIVHGARDVPTLF